MARFCAKCGKELKPGGKFCMSCGSPVQGVKGDKARNVRKANAGNKRSRNIYPAYGEPHNKRKMVSNRAVKTRKRTNIKISKKMVVLVAILICIFCIGKACFPSKKALIGTWVAPGTSNQILEIKTEELRFNGRTFDYIVDGNALLLEQTYPNSSISGKMPFKLRGNSLTIDLGTEFSGFFYGRKGKVKLEKYDTW